MDSSEVWGWGAEMGGGVVQRAWELPHVFDPQVAEGVSAMAPSWHAGRLCWWTELVDSLTCLSSSWAEGHNPWPARVLRDGLWSPK